MCRPATVNNEMVTLRSETLALDAIIRKTAQQASSTNDGPVDRMIFLGNQHQSFPTAMVKDPVLEPVDKLTWMVIMLAVHETGEQSAFPGYDAIGRMANVSSRSTIARAIAILRATRWLTLCVRRRRIDGRYQGHVYALHDEPIPLVDALHLDRDYLTFLRGALQHGHRRVGAVAQEVLNAISEDIQAEVDVCAQPHPIERRFQIAVAEDGRSTQRCFSLSKRGILRLRVDLREETKQRSHHDQNLHVAACHDQISNLSSSINKLKTTTTKKRSSSNIDTTGEDNEPLIYPSRLSRNHQDLAAQYLQALKPNQRQLVLDELAGRLEAEKKGMKPVYDEVSFLQSLCKLMRHGKFQANLGIRIRDARQIQSQTDNATRRANQPRNRTEKERSVRQAGAKKHLAEMRKILHADPKIENQIVTNTS